ncbi:CRISPR-associated endoribonuclease Cas6 [Desulfofalx alkaliphila]|uniref:CRISPR-associated endoribonuclease Cas6 n=1 Tax=Desulfofalx alkaliphila TaxID=105483 RepID=UPI0004E0C465|nr:CRISPR-associated endoribonuclease Cas6 [Desulfofalx alkaliphila]
MHIYVTFKPTAPPLVLPIHYNHIVQSAIYSNLLPENASFFHNEGYMGGGRRYKLFAFSRLVGNCRFNKQKGEVSFSEEMKLVISSPSKVFCHSIVNGLISANTIRLGRTTVKVESIYIEDNRIVDSKLVLKTLSPIVTYSTLVKPDGRKYTVYFQPGEPEFNKQLTNNLIKKYEANYNEKAPAEDLNIKVLGSPKLHVMKYKDFIIKGYSCRLKLFGHQELLNIALAAGLGSKNSQGYGCMALCQ